MEGSHRHVSRATDTGGPDDLVAERVEPGWKLPKWLWKGLLAMFFLSLAVTIVVAIYMEWLT